MKGSKVWYPRTCRFCDRTLTTDATGIRDHASLCGPATEKVYSYSTEELRAHWKDFELSAERDGENRICVWWRGTDGTNRYGDFVTLDEDGLPQSLYIGFAVMLEHADHTLRALLRDELALGASR